MTDGFVFVNIAFFFKQARFPIDLAVVAHLDTGSSHSQKVK